MDNPAIKRSIILVEEIEPRIVVLRGQRIMIDADLALLYGTTTKKLNQAVKRNEHRFPGDFKFQLTPDERDEVVTNCDHLKRLKFSPALPYAFNEHGALMAASVLNTPRAIDVSVYVVRAFLRQREFLASHKELAHKLAELERRVGNHDQEIQSLMHAIRQLLAQPPEPRRGRIGFRSRPDDS